MNFVNFMNDVRQSESRTSDLLLSEVNEVLQCPDGGHDFEPLPDVRRARGRDQDGRAEGRLVAAKKRNVANFVWI